MNWLQRQLSLVNSSDFQQRRHRPDVQIVLYMSILMLLGLMMMFAIGSQRAHVLNESLGTDYGDTYFFIKQLVSVGLALVVFFIFTYLPISWLNKYRRLWLAIGFAACLLLAIGSLAGWGIAEETYGATRWFKLGALGSIQPSEFLKLAVLIYTASFLAKRVQQKKQSSWEDTLIPLGLIVGLATLVIVVFQADLGTGISLFSIIIAMLIIAEVGWKQLATIAAIVGVAGVLLIATAPHRMARIMTFVQGDSSEESAANYHINHAKIALGVGGLTGVGIGNSVQATGYLPEAINDSVFAIMGEMFGFIGLVALMVLFIALFMRLIRALESLVDYRLKLLVAGVFGWLAAHFVLNIGAMIGIIPLTGITLPLLSFGGTSMVFIAAALGLVFQATSYTSHANSKQGDSDANTLRRRRVGRTRDASHRRHA